MVCDDPVVGRRAGAKYCKDECRAEAGRITATLRRAKHSPYRSLVQQFKSTHSRTRNAIETDTEDAGTLVLAGQGVRDGDE